MDYQPTTQRFEGLHVALLTPFSGDSNRIDFDALTEHIQRLYPSSLGICIDGCLTPPAAGFVVGGTTGEGMYLLPEQIRQMLTFISQTQKPTENVSQTKPTLIAGTIKHTPKETFDQLRFLEEMIERSEKNGIYLDAILLSPPIDSALDSTGVLQFYREAAQCTTLPFIAYNIPTRTKHTFTAKELLLIHQETSGQVFAVKDSAPTIALAEEIAAHGASFPLQFLQGNDRNIYPALQKIRDAGIGNGKVASISGASNVWAYAVLESEILRAIGGGDYKSAQQYQKYLNEVALTILDTASNYGGEQPILKVMARAKIPSYPPVVHSGLEEPSPEEQQKILEHLNQVHNWIATNR